MRIIDQVLDMPWKAATELGAWLSYPRVRLLFWGMNLPWDPSWRFYGVPIIQKHRRSTMRLGGGLQLRSSVRSNPLGPTHPVILCTWQTGALLEIGTDFAMTGGSVVAAEHVTIGDRVTVGANCTITDSDFHSLILAERERQPSGGMTIPVVIEDDVFIGMNCLILKGVHIGRGCVVGAGSVVTRNVPPNSVVAGNPARVIDTLEHTDPLPGLTCQ
jgi:acetyltransferase-like isoleucine patch superfamily enzyme